MSSEIAGRLVLADLDLMPELHFNISVKRNLAGAAAGYGLPLFGCSGYDFCGCGQRNQGPKRIGVGGFQPLRGYEDCVSQASLLAGLARSSVCGHGPVLLLIRTEFHSRLVKTLSPLWDSSAGPGPRHLLRDSSVLFESCAEIAAEHSERPPDRGSDAEIVSGCVGRRCAVIVLEEAKVPVQVPDKIEFYTCV